ncbi:MAG: GNAT family N-acetyltransferase [Candidatus Lokiarchaeota archaeon]|nr:GNAT family N-acetyltransferase [Candidatus Lokiarchaeota archaeon]
MLNIDVVENIDDGTVFLRKVARNDSEFLYNSLNLPKVNQFLSLGPLLSMDHSRRLVKSYITYWEESSQFTYIVELFDDDKLSPIGCTSLWNLNWVHQRAEIGIWLVPKWFYKSIGFYITELVKNVAFIHLRLRRLEAHCAVENLAAIQMFVKAGFKQEGILADYINLHGSFHDAIVFALLNENTKKK